jgi:uncharacterized membrane protein
MEPNQQQPEVTVAPPVQETVVVAQAQSEVKTDYSDHKLYAILGYILPFLFFIPLMNESSKNNPFARFHANQQLILLILGLVVYMFANPFLFMTFGYGGYMLSSLLNVGLIVFVIMGVMHASQEEMKRLPLIGGFTLLK